MEDFRLKIPMLIVLAAVGRAFPPENPPETKNNLNCNVQRTADY